MARGIPFAQPPPQQPPRGPLWRWRRHPLRRRSDLVQAWISLGLLIAVLAATPAAMLLAHDTAHRHYTDAARHEARTRQQTTAVLLYDVPSHPEPGSDEAKAARYPVEVRFTDPQGRVRTGRTDAQPQLSAGSRIQVWAGTDGRIADPPMTVGQVRSGSAWWAVAAAVAVPLTGALAHGVTHRLLQRRNLAAWDAAWARTAPRRPTAP
ncbi:hypothetical protein RCO28_24390 [Streptomyces sp. LHD-70]|uniref:Rv1733c family protein n=1 Tax=Streptomyces sp. LHD-70 TaxID=3072140 RepID=UPI00280D89C9|nr:hypothetical protein [Streptomyces sp. LHD-70]MDQ8705611.1 hypothetical protein [Streptomyces sp. LHD-70]